ncbi:MAG: cyclic nucleotide-binding domain-containing protein [Rhizomicrobium sp.]
MTLNIAQKDATFRSAVPFPLMGAPAERAPESLQEHLSVLREHGSSLRFARNESVFQEGDRAQNIYRLVSGTIRLCRHTPDGRRHIAEFVLPGDLFGVFGGTEQAFTAEAVTDVTLVAYSRVQFDRLSERDPRFRANILRHLSTTLMTAQLHTFVLGCQSAKERLASFILRLADRTGAMDTGRLDLTMGRQDIADHLGLTIETICRAVTALKNEKLIAVPTTHQLVLRNVEALCELADGGASA